MRYDNLDFSAVSTFQQFRSPSFELTCTQRGLESFASDESEFSGLLDEVAASEELIDPLSASVDGSSPSSSITEFQSQHTNVIATESCLESSAQFTYKALFGLSSPHLFQ
jgi:hypothetical protein